jgi:hypothetical protein
MKQSISTSEKFDWLDAVMADHRIDARAKVVAYCIMQHLNRGTGFAFVSDPTITDKTGIPKRWVQRARNDLRAAGWIAWRRTGTANIYSPLTEPMPGIAEHQRILKKARRDRRRDTQRVAHQDKPQVAQLERDDPPPVAEHAPPQVAQQETPRVANIPLSDNPVVLTPEKKSLEMITVFRSDFDIFWDAYPKKVGHLRAQKIYDGIVKAKSATADDLLAGATRYARERASEDPKYTKHPATWLNGGHWADEPTQRPRTSKPNNRADSAIAGMRGYLEETYGD